MNKPLEKGKIGIKQIPFHRERLDKKMHCTTAETAGRKGKMRWDMIKRVFKHEIKKQKRKRKALLW